MIARLLKSSVSSHFHCTYIWSLQHFEKFQFSDNDSLSKRQASSQLEIPSMQIFDGKVANLPVHIVAPDLEVDGGRRLLQVHLVVDDRGTVPLCNNSKIFLKENKFYLTQTKIQTCIDLQSYLMAFYPIINTTVDPIVLR